MKRDVTWRGLVGTWRLIRVWSYLLTFRDPPSKIRMGPQWAVGSSSIFKSGGNTGKAMHAILSSSLTHTNTHMYTHLHTHEMSLLSHSVFLYLSFSLTHTHKCTLSLFHTHVHTHDCTHKCIDVHKYTWCNNNIDAYQPRAVGSALEAAGICVCVCIYI